MNKLYPNKLVFVDNAEPDINATNMNIISTALDEVDTRLAGIVPAEDYEELAEQTRINADKAKAAADSAEAIVGIGIATTERAGIVKPDGNTISVEEDGTIHCINGGANYDAELSDTSENAPQNKAVTNALDNINVYVGSDGKLHFVDRTGADSALPFSKEPSAFDLYKSSSTANNKTITYTKELEEGVYVVIPIRCFASSDGTSNYRSLLTYYTVSGVDEITPLDSTTAIYKIKCNSKQTLRIVAASAANSSLTGYLGVYVVKIG